MLVFTISGRRPYATRGAQLTATAGTLLLFRKHSVPEPSHPLIEPWECLYAHFEPGDNWSPSPAFTQLADGVYRCQISLMATRQRVQDAFRRLVSDVQSRLTETALGQLNSGRHDPDLDDTRRELLLTTLSEIFLLAQYEPGLVAELDPRVRTSLDAMAIKLEGHVTVAELSANVNLSPSRFAHLFRSQVGLSPVRALRLMRLRRAALQLQYTNDPITRIAERTGFSSGAELSREFRRAFGVSPRRYRVTTGP